MVYFALHYKKQALKDLERIPDSWRTRIIRAVEILMENPFFGKKLRGELFGIYAMRMWPYRILYAIDRERKIVFILRIGHRQGIYSSN